MLDWSLVQSFLAIARSGSLAAAARESTTSQPTLSRHLNQLEEQLQVRLFERHVGGMEITETGLRLLAQAERMEAAASDLQLGAAGAVESIAGVIRLTASQIMATYVLPPMLVELAETAPDIEIELVADNASSNLLRREADIAVRMYRPTQNDVFTRKVGDLALAMYGSKAYLANLPPIQDTESLAHHRILGSDQSGLIQRGFAEAGFPLPNEAFQFRCDDQVSSWEAMRSGMGLLVGPKLLGDADETLEQVEVTVGIPPLPVWLTSHSELKTSRRVRFVYDFIGERLERVLKRAVNA